MIYFQICAAYFIFGKPPVGIATNIVESKEIWGNKGHRSEYYILVMLNGKWRVVNEHMFTYNLSIFYAKIQRENEQLSLYLQWSHPCHLPMVLESCPNLPYPKSYILFYCSDAPTRTDL